MGDSLLGKAKIALSGEGLRSRTAAAENAALGIKPKKKKKKPAPTPTQKAYRPPQAGVDARANAIAAARAADEAALRAKGLRR